MAGGIFDIVFSFSGIVIMLMISLIVLAYMASKMFNIPELEVFSKIELYELFISVIILLVASVFFGFAEQLSAIITGLPGGPFVVAREFHSRIMIDGVFPAVRYCYDMIVIFSTLNTFQIRPNDSVWTWFFKVCPGADVIVGMFNLLAYGLVIILTSLNAHMFILAFIEATMKDFFLPAGVLLRFFPPTRQAGVFVITLAFAFYAVYPTTYAIHLKVLDKITQIEKENPDAKFEAFDSAKASGYMLATVSTPFVIAGLVGGTSQLLGAASHIPGLSWVAKLGRFAGFLASESFFMAIQPELFSPVLDSIAALSLVTFFLPALSMVITIAFITGVTNFIERKIT